MSFIEKNGKNPHLDYTEFDQSVRNALPESVSNFEIVVMNNFPVAITNSSNIDLIIFVNIPQTHGNYWKVPLGDDHFYIKNKIIAISIVVPDFGSQVELEEDLVLINNDLWDFAQSNSELKWNLVNYLSESMGIQRNHVSVDSLHWIKTPNEGINKNVIVEQNLNFSSIIEYLKLQPYADRYGCLNWKNDEGSFFDGITQIMDNASRDSQTGYITKRKLGRIQQGQNEAASKAFKSIDEKLVIVKGKPGTGKSSDLMHWMLNKSVGGPDHLPKAGLLLTYNHLLVNDLTYIIKTHHNQLSEKEQENSKVTSSNTIHSFMFRLTKNLGVQAVLSEPRMIKLLKLHNQRMNYIMSFIHQIIQQNAGSNDYSVARLNSNIQNSIIDEKIKIVGIEFVQFIERLGIKFISLDQKLKDLQNDHYDIIRASLIDLLSKEIFLQDYHNLLKNTDELITDPDAFFKKHDIQELFEILVMPMKLNAEKILDENGKIDIEKFKTRIRRGIGGFKAGKTVYVDEAQDCHPYEREILYHVFGKKEVVIVDGGKEQLIRYNTLCDWTISKNKGIDNHKYQKRLKSYRMKPAIAGLANFIASKYGLDLNVEPLDTEDTGRIVIRKSSNLDMQVEDIKKLHTLGEMNKCTPYESLLLLCPPTQLQDNTELPEGTAVSHDLVIDEHDNIRQSKVINRPEWALIKKADKEIEEFKFWNATGQVDKRSLGVPGPLSVRAIYYESSRGIEAWSVMCFNLDEFFEDKRTEKLAEFHNLETIYFEPDARNREYAAKWVLMALTRAIDSIYIELKDPKHELSKLILEFASAHPQYISELN